MRLDIPQFRKDFEAAFGKQISVQQLWLLTKMCKNVRLRCRNNTAFNNFMNGVFGPHAQFNTVTKTRISWKTGLPESYPGLSITVNGQSADPAGDDDDSE